jgi:hypothetical protein
MADLFNPSTWTLPGFGGGSQPSQPAKTPVVKQADPSSRGGAGSVAAGLDFGGRLDGYDGFSSPLNLWNTALNLYEGSNNLNAQLTSIRALIAKVNAENIPIERKAPILASLKPRQELIAAQLENITKQTQALAAVPTNLAEKAASINIGTWGARSSNLA